MSGPLTVAAFLGHLAACTTTFPVIAEAPARRVVATAQAESGLHPYAIGDNDTGRSYFPRTYVEAVAKARELLALGHRIDAGAMQITDRNWAAYDLTVETVFDVRTNICAGGRILGEAFQIERRAACRYNTGRPDCRRPSGSNGYPERVDAAAATVRLSQTAVAPSPRPSAPTASRSSCSLPDWDVWARCPEPVAPVSPQASDDGPVLLRGRIAMGTSE